MPRISTPVCSLISASALLASAIPFPALADDCFADPVIQYAGTGTVSSAVFLRNEACMSGSAVLTTLAAGAPVTVIGFTDGWYRVETNGARGWIGQQFLANSATETGTTWSSYHDYMSEYPSKGPTSQPPSTASDPKLISRLSGYILLQTEERGEAWYLDPVSRKRYYMKDGPAAYDMMRSFGLGVTENDYASMANGNTSMKSRLRGRIILRVNAHGEAYYIHPKDLTMTYLKDGAEAYRLMRLSSLGITNADLSRIPSAEIPKK